MKVRGMKGAIRGERGSAEELHKEKKQSTFIKL